MKRSPIVYFLFFSSGVTALIYEIVWTRMLTLVFGHTVFSVSVVLSAFMAGLGLGSYLFGNLIDHVGKLFGVDTTDSDNTEPPALLIYGCIEILVFASCALLSLLLANFGTIYSWIHLWLPDSALLQNTIRVALAFGLIAGPATLMGATLPIITKYYVTSDDRLGSQVGLLYALNTLGAVLGCLITGFFLIGLVGVLQTVLIAAVANLFIGICAIRLYQDSGGKFAPLRKLRSLPLPSLRPEPGHMGWMGVSFICGLTALAYEVLWTRLLVFSISSTVYSFSMMLAVFLLGIFLGSLLIVPLARRIENQRTVLICLQAGIGLYVLFSLYNMNSLLSPPWNSYNLSDPVATFMRYFIDSSSLMLVPTILFGMSFPVLIKIVSGGTANVGRGTGQIYSANSLGAIIGSLVAGFIILPLLGSQDSLALISSINLMMAAWLFLTGSYLSYGVRRGIAVVSLSALLFINLAMPGDLLDRFFMRDSVGARGTDKLLFFEEGLTDTVAVFQDNYGLLDPDAKRLITNGISMSASNVIASRYMKLFAHVPILLLDNPEDVMVVCFGTGQTTGAAGIHPRVKSVDSLELSASVLRAGTTFAKENHDVLNNPKVNYILQDGRNHLLTTKKLYDVITSEPPPPRTAFTVNLYTREYYEMSKARLKPGGIVAQWIPLHSQGEKEVAMHFKTFMEVFPHAIGWISVADEILIIGSDQPIKIDFNKLQQRLQEPVIKKALADIEIHNIYSFLSNIWYLEEDMLKLGSVVPAITDNRPSIEFYLDLGKTIGLSGKEKIVFNRTSFDKIAARITGLEYEDKKKLREYYNVMDLYQRGVMYGNRGQLLEAMSLVEDNNLFQYHLQAGRDQIANLVQQVEKDPDDIGSLLTLGHMYYQIGSHQKSMEILNQVLQKSPDQSYAHLYIAHNLLEIGDSQGARKHYEATAKRDPRQMQVAMEGAALADLLAKLGSDRENLGLATSVAQFYNMKKEYLKALEYTIPALEKDPMDTRLLQSIIFSYRGLGEANEVLIYGSRYEMVEPDNIDLQYIMGEVYSKTMRCKKAVRYFQAVLKKNDNFRDAQNMLDDCQASLDPSDIMS